MGGGGGGLGWFNGSETLICLIIETVNLRCAEFNHLPLSRADCYRSEGKVTQ